MGTNMRPEVSKRNKYWIEKHRHYELKHFCLQYPIWKSANSALEGLSKNQINLANVINNDISNPTERCVEARLFYSERIDMIEKTAKDTDLSLSSYILIAVTEGRSFEYLSTKLDIPCCRDTYYELYRRFFWLLNYTRK